METIEAIESRRSIRRYQDTLVEKEKIDALLEAAIRAPSWVNKQCWRFVVVTDKDIIKKLTDANSMINSWLKDAPAVIVACADPKDSGHNNDLPYYMMDVSLAMENLVLAAADMGLGTCFLAAYDEGKVKKVLGIPDNVRVVTMTPLGYPDFRETLGDKLKNIATRHGTRRPVKEVAHWDRW